MIKACLIPSVACAILAASCNKSEAQSIVCESITTTFTGDVDNVSKLYLDPETYQVKFNKNDQFMTWAVQGSDKFAKSIYVDSEDGTEPVKFKAVKYEGLTQTATYYLAGTFMGTNGVTYPGLDLSKPRVNWTLPETQTIKKDIGPVSVYTKSGTVQAKSCIILYAQTETFDKPQTEVSLHFKHTVSYARMRLKNLKLDAGESVSAIALSTKNKALRSNIYYNPSDGSVSTASGVYYNLNLDVTDLDTDSGNFDVLFVLPPVDLGDTELSFKITTSTSRTINGTVTVPTGKGKFQCGHLHPFSVDCSLFGSDVPSYYVNHVTERANMVQALQSNQLDGFVFWTDTHMADNTKHAPSLIEAVLAKANNPKVFWGGDAVPSYTDNVETWWTVQADANNRILKSARLFNCHGNHDLTCQVSSTSATGYTLPKSQVRSLFQSAMSDVTWSNAETDALYYYFDETASGIRYIVMDTFDKFGDTDAPRAVYQNVNTTQLNWIFSEAVMKAPANSSLVFIMHCNAAFGISNVYKALTALARHEDYGSYKFSTRQDLKLLFTIGGHYHHDMQIATDGVFHIQSECDARYSQGFIRNPFADASITRDSGTINEQAFDYVSLSKDCTMLTMVRVGHGGCRQFHLTPVTLNVGASRQLVSSAATIWYCYDSSSTYSSGVWTLTDNVAGISNSGMVTAKAKGEAVAVAMDASYNIELFYIKVE